MKFKPGSLDIAALDALLELAEGSLPNVPQADREAWIDACLRVRRLRIHMVGEQRPPGGDEPGDYGHPEGLQFLDVTIGGLRIQSRGAVDSDVGEDGQDFAQSLGVQCGDLVLGFERAGGQGRVSCVVKRSERRRLAEVIYFGGQDDEQIFADIPFWARLSRELRVCGGAEPFGYSMVWADMEGEGELVAVVAFPRLENGDDGRAVFLSQVRATNAGWLDPVVVHYMSRFLALFGVGPVPS